MKRFDANGEKLVRMVQVKVSTPERGQISYRFQAGPKHGYNSESIQRFLGQISTNLQQMFPRHDFEFHQIAPGEFRFSCTAERNLVSEPLLVMP